MKKKVLIITGNYLALNLAILLKNNYEIFFLLRKKKKIFKNYNSFIFNNTKNILKYLDEIKPNLIVNFASYLNANINKSYEVNLKIPIILLKWLRNNKKTKLILLGTAAEYGHPKKNPVKENSILKPENLYGLTKSMQSILFQKFVERFNLNVCLVRIFNLYGEAINNKTLVGKINNFFKKNIKDKLSVSNLSCYRDYIHINKAARLLLNVCQKGKRGFVYNICSGKPMLVRSLVKKIIQNRKLVFKNSINEKKIYLKKYSNVKVIYGCNDRIKSLM